jgi:GNAT superfamily N-acetyltransferase
VTLAVRAATPADAGAVYALLAAAGRALAREGFRNWSEPYPLALLERAIAEGALFVAHDGGALVATYALRLAPPHAYDPEPWPEPSRTAMYLNRMAVEPELQRRGIGKQLLAAIHAHAVREGARAIRCDVVTASEGLRRF